MKRILAWPASRNGRPRSGSPPAITSKRSSSPGVLLAEVRERFRSALAWSGATRTARSGVQPPAYRASECFMITIGPDQILRRIDRVLNERQREGPETGMNGEQVAPPARQARLQPVPSAAQAGDGVGWRISHGPNGAERSGLLPP